MKKQGTLIVSCLVAAAAGVAIGMLIAPESGGKLRKDVGNGIKDWASRLAEMMKTQGGTKDTMTGDGTDHEVDEKPVTGGLS
jgi:gas vesicle protein